MIGESHTKPSACIRFRFIACEEHNTNKNKSQITNPFGLINVPQLYAQSSVSLQPHNTKYYLPHFKSQSSVNFRLPCCDKFSTNSAHQTNRCPNVLTYQGKV